MSHKTDVINHIQNNITGCNRDYKVGDCIVFGHYEQNNDTTNGNEPILWRILDINSFGQYLIISEKVLDVKPYNEKLIDITWENSTIRSWLNNDFFDTAFTAEEKSKIIAFNVSVDENPEPDTSLGKVTTDKVFLLSRIEAKKYFTNDENRKADATCLAKEHISDYTDIHFSAYWWLRSLGLDRGRAAFIDRHGSVHRYGYFVNFVNFGIRPALWIKR